MSSVRVGKEAVILEELRNHADPPGSAYSDVPTNFTERLAHDSDTTVSKSP
ncbi:hypothetical protein PENARI_c019G06550 [Penicillium arizonense]|uniref:Uncharacterized protein n=1 Tax=Penicillium arizonense TaxID=1835702 RepID=A0A1F5L988_PENAI|nr:hypothetical protein PENARI_c019G06550 [Penicillium arizonense]OGE49798.1 hypothetical protein PENARI_c019G06550 [Penicillium arizonense]